MFRPAQNPRGAVLLLAGITCLAAAEPPVLYNPDKTVTISSTAASTSPTTGALTLGGGLGVGCDITVGGRVTSTLASTTGIAGIHASSAAPGMSWNETDAGSDLGRWDIHAAAGNLVFRTVNDALSATTEYMRVMRTGAAATRVHIPLTTVSASSTSGALTVAGGIGVVGRLNVGGAIMTSAARGTNMLGFHAHSAVPGVSLNETDAAANNRLWDQFADNGVLRYRAVSDDSTVAGDYLRVSRSGAAVSNVHVPVTTESTSATSGALTVAGGVGIGGKLRVAGDIWSSGVVRTNYVGVQPQNPSINEGGELALYASGLNGYNQSMFMDVSYDILRFKASSGHQMTMNMVNGNVGIGTAQSTARLHVIADAVSNSVGQYVPVARFTNKDLTNTILGINSHRVATASATNAHETQEFRIQRQVSSYSDMGYVGFGNWYTAFGTANAEHMRLTSEGNLGIGTKSPQSKLSVNGTITARELIITPAGWADSVFDAPPSLDDLEAVAAHIKAKKHLPGIPSEAEVVTKGIGAADMFTRQMAKIEELTIHAINLKRERDRLQAAHDEQQTLLSSQRQQLDAQQAALQGQQALLAALEARLARLEAAAAKP